MFEAFIVLVLQHNYFCAGHVHKMKLIDVCFACSLSSGTVISEESRCTITGIFRLGGNDRVSANH